MPGSPQLPVWQVLVTTLVVKLAVMAALATMLVRYRRFRHILIFERRDWRDRLTFVLALGLPLTLGVVVRLLLNYKAADLTLEGAFLVGLVAGPYAGAIVGMMVGIPALANAEFIALPFAVGCGFAGGGLRELCPKEAIWHFSPFVFTRLPARVWQMLRTRQIDWQVALVMAPIGLELTRQAVGLRWSPHQERLFFLDANPFWTLAVILLATVLAVESDLRSGPIVYRYRWDDGLPGREGGFHLCTAWLVEAYLRTGRRADAEELFEQMIDCAGPTGLLPEQYDPMTERGLGNHPQAYSHLGLINCALLLST